MANVRPLQEHHWATACDHPDAVLTTKAHSFLGHAPSPEGPVQPDTANSLFSTLTQHIR
jgi:hypothetical protein